MHHTNNTIRFYQFIHHVIVAILAIPDDIPREAADDSTSRLVGCHLAKQLERPAIKGRRNCCVKNKKTSGGHAIKTAFICKTCPSQPELHTRECFEIYHMVLDFKE